MLLRSTTVLLALLLAPALANAVPIGSPNDQWTAVPYLAAPDFADDQATGAHEADIVGNAGHPAVYTFFDDLGTPSTTDGILGFRIRLGVDENPAGFKHLAVVGLDANLDGALDILLVVNNKGGSPEIAIRPVEGAGTSPSTTAIGTGGVAFAQTAANYGWQAVSVLSDPAGTTTDVDGDGNTDYLLSFSVDFQQLVNQLAAVGITNFGESSAVQLAVGTSTNTNSVNQDWAGPNGNVASTQNWGTLGAFTQTFVIPEPRSALLLAFGLALIARSRRS